MFKDAIDEYTAQDRNGLRDYQLTSAEWDAIQVVHR